MTGQEQQHADVLVVGAGPAGLLAGIAAAREGARVVLLERKPDLGGKLPVTGGGRCNLSNTLPVRDVLHALGRAGKPLRPALQALDADGLRRMFDELGMATFTPDGFHVYPVSESAGDVTAALVDRAVEHGITIQSRTETRRVLLADARVRGVATADGELAASAVLLACGGAAWSSVGGCSCGYALARQCGHSVRDPLPALAPLITAEDWPGRLSGLSVAPTTVRVVVDGTTAATHSGAVLFTHRGLSGPAILDGSGTVSEALHAARQVHIDIDFRPDSPHEDWLSWFRSARQSAGAKRVHKLLEDRLPRRLAHVLCETAGVPPEIPISRLTRQQRERLVLSMRRCRLTPAGTAGLDRAMVTRGGVSLQEIDSRTMASRIVTGLFFAGELLDVDGPCGGFNLRCAFATGHLAGLSAAAAARA